MGAHKNLTGADLHEPKGVENASSGMVYVADGAGSGVWTLGSDLLTEAAWTAGDVKVRVSSTVPTGWVALDDRTIGDASSNASNRANADTEDLFTVIWNELTNSVAPVYTSAGVATTRGASAAADFAAHKRIALPRVLGRGLGLTRTGFTGSGLTVRGVGEYTGTETVTLVRANLPNITFQGTTSGSLSTGAAAPNSIGETAAAGATQNGLWRGGTTNGGTGNTTGSLDVVVSTAGSDTPVANVGPIVFLNGIIKL
jgi:microcystin-dependent protein